MTVQEKAGGVGRLRRLLKKARAAEQKMVRRAERTQRRLAVLGTVVRDAERALAEAQATAAARKAEKARRRRDRRPGTDEVAALPAIETGGIVLSETIVVTGAPVGEVAEAAAPGSEPPEEAPPGKMAEAVAPGSEPPPATGAEVPPAEAATPDPAPLSSAVARRRVVSPPRVPRPRPSTTRARAPRP